LNKSVVGLPIFGSSFAISPEQAVRIYMLYFSLLSLFLGSVLYAFRCSEFFKRYENVLMYVNSEIDVLTLPAPAREVLYRLKEVLT
jgi:hypothetical protein